MASIHETACPHCGCLIRISSADIRFWKNVQKSDSCWLWTGRPSTNGYGRLYGNDGRDIYAHRFSWEIHNGPIPDGLWVLHRCDTPLCVRPDHLFLGTHDENMADMSAKRRTVFQQHPERAPRGAGHGYAKLTDDAVRNIRTLRANGTTVPTLARMFNVCKTTIKMVVSRKTWKHIT